MPSAGTHPHLWVTGPDPVRHEQYIAWQRAKAQAAYRRESWNLTFEDWIRFWGDDWERRGRMPGQVRMTRLDWSLPWELSNMAKMSQQEHNAYNAQRRRKN